MKSLKQTFILSVLVVSISAVTGANAQQGPSSEPQVATAAQHETMNQSTMMEKMQAKMKDRMEKHRAQVHEKLKITAAQETAWKTFTESMAPASMMNEMENHHMDRKAMDAVTAPVMIEQHLAQAKQHLAQMQKHADAVKTFYAVLSPEQQKTFDEVHKHMRHQMRNRMMRRMGEMHQAEGTGWEI